MDTEDDVLASQSFDTRGWAMRHGHCKALLQRRRKPKSPAKPHGRNAFSRTVNANVDGRLHDDWLHARIKRTMWTDIRDEMMTVECEEWHFVPDEEEIAGEHFSTLIGRIGACWENGSSIAEELPSALKGHVRHKAEQCCDSIQQLSNAPMVDSLEFPCVGLLRQRSSPSTVVEVRDAKSRIAKAYVPLEEWHNLWFTYGNLTSFPRRSALSSKNSARRWEEAVVRADGTMQAPMQKSVTESRLPCVPPLPGSLCASPTRIERRRQEQRRVMEQQRLWAVERRTAWNELMSQRKQKKAKKKTVVSDMHPNIQQCLDKHQSLVKDGVGADALQKSTKEVFDCFQQLFLGRHRSCILSSLAGSSLASFKPSSLKPHAVGRWSELTLKPADLSLDVQLRFLKAWVQLGGTDASIRPVFHGTNPANIASIYERGLLIPGMGNDLQVAHGSAHGLGIYTANLDHANLSYGFGGRNGLLVCGVLDDAVQLPVPKSVGNLTVTAESEAVRHVGGAVVVFDPRRVAPLFHVLAPKVARIKHNCMRRLDKCLPKQNKKRQRHAAVRARQEDGAMHQWRMFVTRRAAQRHRGGRGLGRSGVGALGLASKL